VSWIYGKEEGEGGSGVAAEPCVFLGKPWMENKDKYAQSLASSQR